MKNENLAAPSHIAFIMDGNGRWAARKKLHRNFGHREGVKTVERVLSYCLEFGVKELTLYAFSTENWNRPKKEIEGLFKLIGDFFSQSESRFMRDNVCVRVIGSRENLTASLIDKIERIQDVTKENVSLQLNICFNYGGREEMLHAMSDMARRGVEICELELRKSLYTHGMSDPDLVVRTSGEKRLSNFLLYQAAYAELHFIDCLWPDFSREDFTQCIEEYKNRQRRFGRSK